MREYPLVVITWRDHASDDAWRELPEIQKHLNTEAPIVSAGYLVEDSETRYVIMQNISTGDDNLMSMAMAILKADVEGYVEIPEGALRIEE